ncbi:hypothetical protein ABZ763_22270 [Streptomyces bacillaris]|uniref:hypothetical protein n=1 Tax=Streptomyces bacillaris TaxID=68179 RepID=UPI00345FF3C7
MPPISPRWSSGRWPPSGSLLVPVLLAFCPLLVAAQAWTWHAFRHRVTRPSYL